MEAAAKKRGLKWAVVFFAAMACAIPISKFIDTHSEIAWLVPVFAIGFLVLIIGILGWMIVFLRQQQKKFGVACPHCGKALVGFCSSIAIASGNCSGCGEPVFEQTANQSQFKG